MIVRASKNLFLKFAHQKNTVQKLHKCAKKLFSGYLNYIGINSDIDWYEKKINMIRFFAISPSPTPVCKIPVKRIYS